MWHNCYKINRYPGRTWWISCRCGSNCRTNHSRSCHPHIGASRWRLHCIQTLPVDICRWACHRPWMSSTRLSTRGLKIFLALPLSGGMAGNWLEGGLSQGRARNWRQLIQTQLCSQPKADSSWKCSQDVGEWQSNQIPTWRVQDQAGSVLLC